VLGCDRSKVSRIESGERGILPVAVDPVSTYRVYLGRVRTSQVARWAGVNIHTLRYYQRRGLLAESPRTGTGYRQWGPEAVQAVRFVKQAQELGFSLAEIAALLHLADSGVGSCHATREVAAAKIDQLDTKIAALESMRASLSQLVSTCDRPRAERDCPLPHSLQPPGDPGGSNDSA
jgi:DNA-binding transcriptional MerR regulator